MVGSRRATLRTIIEYRKFWIVGQQSVYLTITAFYQLRFMTTQGYCKMRWKYWEWIYEQLVIIVQNLSFPARYGELCFESGRNV